MMPTLAFVYESSSSFILQDLELLSAIMPVNIVRWSRATRLGRLLVAILTSDVVFVWFVAGQAATSAFVLSKAFRKKIIVVAGGSEVCPNEGIHGSGLRSAVRFLLTRVMLNNCDHVIAVSEYTKREVLTISSPRKISVVYHGIDSERFSPREPKNGSILTVAAGRTWDQVLRKGLDRFIQLANLLPETEFTIVGEAALHPKFRNMVPSNVQITGEVRAHLLLSFYRRASFYCQLSRHEGFGVAVAEAMACKCVPVVSDSGALPEVVGTCGLKVREGDSCLAAKKIKETKKARVRMRDLGDLARLRVIQEFPLEKRASCLRHIIRHVVLSPGK
jgi:glycosyltransferase involved in cell wall biosynthesis